jgi:hypothetical protein
MRIVIGMSMQRPLNGINAPAMRPQRSAVRKHLVGQLISVIASAAMVTGMAGCASSRSRAVPTGKPAIARPATSGARSTTERSSTTRGTRSAEGNGTVVPTGRPSTDPAVTISEVRSPRGAVVGVARMDLRRARISLFGGGVDPGQGNDGQVPVAQRAGLLAAFNGGFLLRQSHGGLFLRGRAYKPLIRGAASVAVRRDGTATVGMWDRDITMTRDVVAVRQNLTLLVDRSAPIPGLVANNTLFGATIGHRAAVSRSGLCNASDGALVYAAGRDLTAADLAGVMVAAGCVRGMELDINPQFVVFIAYRHVGATLAGTRLVPSMHYGQERFLNPQSRDFFAVFSR